MLSERNFAAASFSGRTTGAPAARPVNVEEWRFRPFIIQHFALIALKKRIRPRATRADAHAKVWALPSWARLRNASSLRGLKE